ncbi:hypothetical protein [Wenxinia marina]|uniref:Uncharacterized protein n=1 Tax=Wenxinia marina DSM 24838 TaxID=1123501 RepID=A0A0D0NKL1_9RHOB|nr:hypothetical protein [Wenxinia marina]KIQ68860.1 hypothetical protein Wenmar_02589 [Wenxinia marina DSM 24838]GGL64646.1 hypothetical protein GCM10011392_19120 [Wenxinia marina]
MAERKQLHREFSEELSSLWRIAIAPSVWAIHFVASYGLAAVWCAKWSDATLLGDVSAWRVLICGASVVALGIIGWIGWKAWRQWDFLEDWDYTHPLATEEDRHEFLGHAAFLLAVLSAVGVIATTLPALLISTCT